MCSNTRFPKSENFLQTTYTSFDVSLANLRVYIHVIPKIFAEVARQTHSSLQRTSISRMSVLLGVTFTTVCTTDVGLWTDCVFMSSMSVFLVTGRSCPSLDRQKHGVRADRNMVLEQVADHNICTIHLINGPVCWIELVVQASPLFTAV